jgi:hypothetical protein
MCNIVTVVGIFCCGAFLWFPASIVFTGWNEQQAACRHWGIDEVEKLSKQADCASNVNDATGSPYTQGDLAFVSCGVNAGSFKTFTHKDFAGLESVESLIDTTANNNKGAAMKMTVKQYFCIEECAQSVCDRRLEADDGKELSQEDIESDDEEDEFLLRRLGKGGGGSGVGSESCTERCVAWSHRLELMESEPIEASSGYSDSAGAAAACGTPLQPTSPVKLGDSYSYAPTGTVKTLPNDAWSLNEYQLEQLPLDVPVTLQGIPRGPEVDDAKNAPSQLTRTTVYVEANTMKTCVQKSIGCLEVTFSKAVPDHVALLGALSPIEGLMTEYGWTSPSYWLCKNESSTHFNAICPSVGQDLYSMAHKGDMSCGKEVTTFEQMVEMMRTARSQTTWLFRALAFLGFFCAINCCFHPIEAMLEFLTDMMDDATDCIPCVGCCVDTLTDVFMGAVRCILFIASFCCALGWFLSVVCVTWIVMRPLMGLGLGLVTCCACSGAGALLYQFRGGGKRDGFKKGIDDQYLEDNHFYE